jgi:hypothetical protein
MCSPRLPRLWTVLDLLRELNRPLPILPMPRVRTCAAGLAVTAAAAQVALYPLPPHTRPPARFMDRARTVRQLTDPNRAA